MLKFKIGDILLVNDSRIAMVKEVGDKITTKEYELGDHDHIKIQYMDCDSTTIIFDFMSLTIHRNFGQEDSVYAAFYMARSVHARLNESRLADDNNRYNRE